MLEIQFPLSSTNNYWDGKEHVIVPYTLVCINDSDYYYMDGFDKSFGFTMYTLLGKNGDKFSKIPLDDYQEFQKVVTSSHLTLFPTNILGDKIDLQPEMTVEELKTKIGSKRR